VLRLFNFQVCHLTASILKRLGRTPQTFFLDILRTISRRLLVIPYLVASVSGMTLIKKLLVDQLDFLLGNRDLEIDMSLSLGSLFGQLPRHGLDIGDLVIGLEFQLLIGVVNKILLVVLLFHLFGLILSVCLDEIILLFVLN
jgi:hypothetical protein